MMEIIQQKNMIHAESSSFVFSAIDDVACADSKNARYERVGDLVQFTFKNFTGSRRLFRVLCKRLTKQCGDQ